MRASILLSVLFAAACTTAPPRQTAPSPVREAPAEPVGSSRDAEVDGAPGTTGVLVMAHGGTGEWNVSVEAAVAPLRGIVPTAVAYGMANPRTLSAALDSLEAAGATRVAVVRMFLSGESFMDQTRYYLGMSDTPPATFVLMGPAAADPEARRQLEHDLTIATHTEGILVSPEAATIMAERARSLSVDPGSESVLLLAHGMGDEGENDRVLRAMGVIAEEVRTTDFASVRTATLREDWAPERERAEAEIRSYVDRESDGGRRVIVLPMRLSGFGPYAEVLDGLRYVPGEGLLPHDEMATWVRRTANRVSCGAGWGSIDGSCATAAANPDSTRPAPPRD